MEKIKEAAKAIEEELEERVKWFKSEDKLLEAQRIAERTNFDIEMMRETGFVPALKTIPGIWQGWNRERRHTPCWIIFRMNFC